MKPARVRIALATRTNTSALTAAEAGTFWKHSVPRPVTTRTHLREIFRRNAAAPQNRFVQPDVAIDGPCREPPHRPLQATRKLMPASVQNVALNWARKSHALSDALPVLHLFLRRAFAHLPSTHRRHIALVRAVHDDAAGAQFILPLPVASFFWGQHDEHAPAGGREFDG
ncbi:uncharacterized protein Tco025E_09048 [Trypanosoma conorhini]|uniref:Uncharacterized protein n=1 Tax=Trypanosoma conorhini TaxID=83891 RepID=A0A422N1E4_9TRYP|nr:uncharacterized protein Tco025E_09048 [Trypanosoma conorhini]RNE99288.1 hypothetical protein Tco025E_09048 [Trypanosoma conorhini]